MARACAGGLAAQLQRGLSSSATAASSAPAYASPFSSPPMALLREPGAPKIVDRPLPKLPPRTVPAEKLGWQASDTCCFYMPLQWGASPIRGVGGRSHQRMSRLKHALM